MELFELDSITNIFHNGESEVEGLWQDPIFEWDLEENFGEDLNKACNGWSALSGFTGQCGGGPFFHPSEFISENMKREFLAKPGQYAVVAKLDEDNGDYWAIFYRPWFIEPWDYNAYEV